MTIPYNFYDYISYPSTISVPPYNHSAAKYHCYLYNYADFVREMKQYIQHGSLREQPSYRGIIMGDLKPEVLFGILKPEKGISEEQLGRRGDDVMHEIVAELLYKYCEIIQRQIGSLLV